MTSETIPSPGRKAIATLGPDYAPTEHVEVEILRPQGTPELETWLCQDSTGRLLIVRTRKLKLL